MPTVPQGLTDALNTALTAKDQADSDAAAVTAAQTALAAAQTVLSTAQSKATASASALEAARKQLEAVEDAYLTPGGSVPAAPVAK